MQNRWDWYVDLGIDPENLRFYRASPGEVVALLKRTVDIEYRFEFAGSEWAELRGLRTDFDLKTHPNTPARTQSYFDQATGERWVLYVVEPAAGLTRCVLAFLLDAYAEDEAPNTKGRGGQIAPCCADPARPRSKAAVLPLSRNEALSPKAQDLAAQLRSGGTSTSTTRVRSVNGIGGRTRSARRTASRLTSTPWTTMR